MSEIGRNDPCHCGSKKKYKKCHLEKDVAKDSKEREKAAAKAAKLAEKEEKKDEKAKQTAPKHKGHKEQNWMQKLGGKTGFFRGLSQRKAPPSNKGG